MKILFTFSLLVFSLSSLAQINNYRPEPVKELAVKGLITKYTPALINRWKNTPVVRFIDFDSIQATASIPNYIPTLDFYSGIFKALSAHELAIVTCHELGHLLGDISLRQSDHWMLRNFDHSPESEADYWGGKCVKEYVKENDLSLDELQPHCLAVPEEERGHCSFAISMYLSTYSNLFNAELRPEAAAGVVYQGPGGIDFQYASNDCRALTAIHAITGQPRPSCWYNPGQ